MYKGINNEDNMKLVIIMVIFFLSSLYLISPVVSFFSMIAFLSLVNIDDKGTRILFTIFAIVAGVTIYSSRFVHPVELGGDDFSNQYQPLFEYLANGGSIWDSKFGGGVEFGLPLIYKLISYINPKATPYELFFTVSFICCVSFYFWIELFFIKDVPTKYKSLCIASFLLFFGFFITTQLIRQALSSVFIVYAISYLHSGKKNKGIIFSILAITFHLTAVAIIPIIYLLMYGKNRAKFLVFISFLFFGLLFSVFLGFISSGEVFSVIASKFLYYNQNTDSSGTSAYYWKILLIFTFGLLVFKKNSSYKEYKSLLIYGTLCYLSLIKIPFASDRTFMVLVIYLLGLIAFIVFNPVLKFYRVIILFLCLYRALTLGPFYDLNCYDNALCLWTNIHWYGNFF